MFRPRDHRRNWTLDLIAPGLRLFFVSGYGSGAGNAKEVGGIWCTRDYLYGYQNPRVRDKPVLLDLSGS